MKPAAFDYDAPADLGDVLALLAEHGDDAKVIAGGQSLVPLMNFRLARPARLVDINGVAELAHLAVRDGSLRIGAMTRHAELERSDAASAWPLLLQAVEYVGHPPIRNRGTVGGSVAHADPAAELPVALTALDARFHVRSARGARTVATQDFFVTHLTTSLEPDELLAEIEVPALPARTGTAFVEFSRRHGDFALGGAAAIVTVNADGTCERAALALLGAAPTPLRATAAESALAGQRAGEAAREAAALAVSGIEPPSDAHGDSDYRKGLIEAMAYQALVQADAAALAAAR